MVDIYRDLWIEARTSHRPNRAIEIVRNVIQSLPGQPTKTTFRAMSLLGRENSALAVDLNKYRINRNLKAYQDAGVDIFILRIGGPSQWIDGDWRYQQDVTYCGYLEQCDKLGVLDRTIGYIVHNPFEIMTPNGATGETIHTELIDDWTAGGYMPKAFVYDHEVAKCYRSTGAEVIATNYNLVKSLAENTLNTYKKFRRMVGVYSARWFTNTYGPAEHLAYFDNINKPESLGGAGKQRPMWWAWYPQTFPNPYTDLQDSLSDLLQPTADQTGKYLQCGSYSLADLWQFTYTLKLTGGMLDGSDDTIGVDASVSLGTVAEVCAAFGLGESITPPPPPPDSELAERVTAAEQRLDGIDARLANAKVTITI